MTQYFHEEEYTSAKEQRKKTLIIFYVILSIYLLASIAFVIYYTTLPYKSPIINDIKTIHHVITAVMSIFSMLYLGIAFKRVNRFYRMMFNLKTGLKETTIATFLRYDETPQEKDGVDCKALIFSEWNKYKKDYYERKVLVLEEKEYPEFTENQTIKFVTQGNLLISYEIIEDNDKEDNQ